MKLPMPKRAKKAPEMAVNSKPELSVGRIKANKMTSGLKLKGRSKFVLNIGDEGTILVYYKSGNVEGRWFAGDPSDENKEVFSKALATDSSAPILIVLDTIDQTYSQQTLPPVSKMNLGGLLKRRIKREFGDVALKGSYLLGRNSESKEWNFMLYAIEQNETVQSWIEWLLKQGHRPLGVRVMPLEMTSLVTSLYKIYASAENVPEMELCQWKFIVSHNKVSGFRQVIVKNNHMVFTRLGQTLDGGPDVQAGMIEQEIASTLEYLKRIGLKSLEDLHLHVIAAQDIVQIIDTGKMGVNSHKIASPYQTGQMLGWDNIAQPEDKFADVFLSIFALMNKKPIANLWTQALDKIKKLFLIKPALRAIVWLVVLFSLGYMSLSGYNWWNQSKKLDGYKQQVSQFDEDISELKSAVNLPPEELEKVLDLYDLYLLIQKQKLDSSHFFGYLSKAFQSLPEDMLVQEISWAETDEPAEGNANTPPTEAANGLMASAAPPVQSGVNQKPAGIPKSIKGNLNIDIKVPNTIKSEALQARAESILNKLQPLIPHYVFKLDEIPGAKSSNDSISIDLNKTAETVTELSPVTLKTSFTGTEYIPEPDISDMGH